mmetsp:Transcript_23033/g.54379  ORF Transcript_23033/g.54379 Transcript_23033/m.54379 type:complete len:205 (-) Transcript_23033:322-936(-)
MVLGMLHPGRWYSVMPLKHVIGFCPLVFWIIVHKNRRIPAPVESVRSSMEDFATLVKQDISARQNNLVSVSMEILNQHRPRIGIVRGINVQDKTDHVGLSSVNVHMQLAVVSIETKSVCLLWCQLHVRPDFWEVLQFLQDTSGQVGTVDEPGCVSVNDFYVTLQPWPCSHAVSNAFAQRLHEIVWSSCQCKPVFRKVGGHNGSV